MALKKVLVADDDPNVRDIIHMYFEEQNLELIEACNGREAVELTEKKNPDIIILDVIMPIMGGLEAFKEIKHKFNIPVLFLSAKSDEIDRILGLELGAVDYITKPFSPRELVARIKAVFRLLKEESNEGNLLKSQTYEVSQMKIDMERREVLVCGDCVDFSLKELDLLFHLVKSPGHVHTREQLLKHVWGYDFLGDVRTVDTHITKLRKKLRPYPHLKITTVWGIGYKFVTEDNQ